MKNFFCILLVLSVHGWAFAQAQLGLRLENYAGVSSMALNPATHLAGPLRWDVNLAGAGLFFDNNYAYITGTNSFNLLNNAEDSEFFLAQSDQITIPSNAYMIDFYNDDFKRFFSARTFVAGPSLMVKIGENHSVGFFTNVRMEVSSLNFPNELSYYKYDLQPQLEPFFVRPFSGALISWAEIGLNYGVRIPVQAGYMGFGINLKYLAGYEGGYIENHQQWVHTKLPNDTAIIRQAYGGYGFTFSNLKEKDWKVVRNGKGFGVDLGFLYVIEAYEGSYKWRLGASLLDIGAIRFDRNAQSHTVRNNSSFHLTLRDYDDFQLPGEWEALLRHFSSQATGDSLASFSANNFTVALPAALSLQADYSFNENIFLNALVIHHLPTGAVSPQRGTVVALTPRYEHEWFSVSFPVSLLNWQKVRMGFAARLGYLVVGSDNLGSLLGHSKYSGTDIYAALKLNRIRFGGGWQLFGGKLFGGEAKTDYHRRRGKVKCYDF
ncbi:MAG TPA: hypothetical protein ENJ95_05555 [Bacteroidetes bacterium]|nr:hypothetical protein [Bacteroidota bacterium]